jgi:hypothetical protein
MSGEHPATAPDAAAMHATYVSLYVCFSFSHSVCIAPGPHVHMRALHHALSRTSDRW